MPALNLPGLTTAALPASAASPSTREIGQPAGDATAQVGVAGGGSDAPTHSFGQHLRQARGKASGGAKATDADQQAAARTGGAGSRRRADLTKDASASGQWPSTLHTATMNPGLWSLKSAAAGAAGTADDSGDARATALLDAAKRKTARSHASAEPLALGETYDGQPPGRALKAFAEALAGADGQANVLPAERPVEDLETRADPTDAAAGSPLVGGDAKHMASSKDARDVAGPDNISSPDAAVAPEKTDEIATTGAAAPVLPAMTAPTKAKVSEDTAVSAALVSAQATALGTDGDDTTLDKRKARETSDSLSDTPTTSPDANSAAAAWVAPTAVATMPSPAAESSADLGNEETNRAENVPAPLQAAKAASTAETAAMTSTGLSASSAPTASGSIELPRESVAGPRAAVKDADSSRASSDTEKASAATPATPATQPLTAHTAQIAATTSAAQPITAPVAATVSVQPDAAITRAQEIASATPQASVTSVYEATIDPAIDTAAFAPALGARISILARDGVEQARLNVHPADMGPISVQLSMDGTQVRVDFSAEVAGTRQTLEEAMPSLAASLRDAGFTLSGGGVSQQNSQSGRPSDGGQAGGNAGAGAGTAAAGDETSVDNISGSPRAGREAGLVDLFA